MVILPYSASLKCQLGSLQVIGMDVFSIILPLQCHLSCLSCTACLNFITIFSFHATCSSCPRSQSILTILFRVVNFALLVEIL